MSNFFSHVIISAALVCFGANATAQDNAAGSRALVSYDYAHHPVMSRGGMVSTQERQAADVGAAILAKGGNAVDAAVATGFALAVTHPQAGNLGGGGFMLVYVADTQETIAIDFREMAPAAATRDMYLNDQGDVDNKRAQYSHLSAGVPGTVMGLLEALETYGTMDRKAVMAPAIKLARSGFELSFPLADSLERYEKTLSVDPSSAQYFVGLEQGEIWKQRDLANTLKRISRSGVDGFYKGKTADLIVAEMEAGGGLITHEDLANYVSVIRDPVKGDYKGYEVNAMSPPSSGGVHMVQMLNILSGYNLKSDGHNSAAYLHKLIESMRRAYADRSKYLGDPDFFDVPVDALTDTDYAARLRDDIDLSKSSRSADILPGSKLPYEAPSTTHYSVIDEDGNAVSVTYTLNFTYGSGYSVDGAGFLLNNEMDDFSAKPGSPNGYGLIGGEANKIEPRKRPLSSMTPVIVTKDGKAVLASGSPGGSTIITAVMQVVLNVIEWDMNISEATHRPRIHHQWLPDRVTVEPALSRDTLDKLAAMGHRINRDDSGAYTTQILGRVNSVGMGQGVTLGAADSRGPESAAIGEE